MKQTIFTTRYDSYTVQNLKIQLMNPVEYMSLENTLKEQKIQTEHTHAQLKKMQKSEIIPPVPHLLSYPLTHLVIHPVQHRQVSVEVR